MYVYFNANFNVFFKSIKVHLLVSELYIYQNARCNERKKKHPFHTTSIEIEFPKDPIYSVYLKCTVIKWQSQLPKANLKGCFKTCVFHVI